MYTFIFGVFNSGKLVMAIGDTVKCNHDQAALIVAILQKGANKVLNPGDYIACDYTPSI